MPLLDSMIWSRDNVLNKCSFSATDKRHLCMLRDMNSTDVNILWESFLFKLKEVTDSRRGERWHPSRVQPARFVVVPKVKAKRLDMPERFRRLCPPFEWNLESKRPGVLREPVASLDASASGSPIPNVLGSSRLADAGPRCGDDAWSGTGRVSRVELFSTGPRGSSANSYGSSKQSLDHL